MDALKSLMAAHALVISVGKEYKLYFAQLRDEKVVVPGFPEPLYRKIPYDASSYDLNGNPSHESVMKRVPAFDKIYDEDTWTRDEVNLKGEGWMGIVAIYRHMTLEERAGKEKSEKRDEAKAVGVLNITPPANDTPHGPRGDTEEVPKRKGR